MEALNAASAPISCLSDRRIEPRKKPSPNLPLKASNSARLTLRECLSKGFHGGLVLLSSAVNARALTYEEALQQSVTSSDFDSAGGGLDLDLDGVVSFGLENPVLIAGGVAVLAVPLLLSQFLNKPKPWGVDSARNAYEKLGLDPNAQLLDIRPPGEIRTVGTPNVKGLGKKSVSLVYKGEDKPGFLKKLAFKFKDPQNTTLFILDKFDGSAELAAELVTVNGFKAAYAIKDGAEGPRGWINSSLPWIEPKKGLSLDLSSLTDAFSGVIGDGSEGLSVAFAVAAATGIGLLAFTEMETVLQLLGSAALVQFVSKKLLLAEDRQATLKEVNEFLNNKIAPKELVGDVKAIGKALLPSSVGKALPAPAEASTKPVSADSSAEQVEAVPEPKVEPAPVPQVLAESNGGFPRPQSPYPYYADFKPPSSPTPPQAIGKPVAVPEEAATEPVAVPAEAATEPVAVPEEAATEPVPVPAEAATEPVDVPAEAAMEPVPVPAETEAVEEPKVEPVPQETSAPQESASAFPRPQSPYPYYEDLKPPSSPAPSRP